MNYAVAISSRLGVDTKPFSDGMNQAAADGQRAGDKIANSTNRAAAAHDSLLGSSKRVGHQISNVAREMISGADATQIFATGLEGLGRSLKLSLGTIAGLFVGGVIVAQIAKAREEMTKLHNEIAKLGDTSNLRFEAFEKLSTRLTEIRKKMAELKEALPQSGHYVTFKQIWNTIAHPIDSIRGQPEKDEKKLREANVATMLAEASKLARSNKIAEVRSEDPYAADRMKAYDELLPKARAAFLDKNMALLAEELRAYAITIKEINKKQLDASRTTLEYLAEHGTNGSRFQGYKTVPFQGRELGLQEAAQKALEEKAAYEKDMLGGRNPDEENGANYHRRRYDELVGGMSDIVKSSEVRALDLRGAALTTLQMIERNTAHQFSHK